MTETEKLRRALSLALLWLEPNNCDSRGASPEFVAMAAVACDCADDTCMKVIEDAIASHTPQAPLHAVEVSYA